MEEAMAAIGYNNKMSADEAQKVLGCSYSTIIGLINRKKIKAQKYEGSWFLDADEVYKAKETKLVVPRIRKVEATIQNTTEVSKIYLELPKDKVKMLELLFSQKNSSLSAYLLTQINKLIDQVNKSLSDINI